MPDSSQIIGIGLVLLCMGNSLRLILTEAKRIRRIKTKNDTPVDITEIFKLKVMWHWVIAGIITLAIW